MKALFTFFILFYFQANSFAQNHSVAQNEDKESLNYGFYLLENDSSIKAEKHFRKHLNSLESPKEKRKSCYHIALRYNNMLYFDLSISYALEGINHEWENDYLVKELYQVIAVNHLDLTNFQLAEEYYEKSLKHSLSLKNITANDYNLIGEITRLNKNLKRSLSYFYFAIKINKLISDDTALLMNYNNIGLAYLELGELDSASFYLNNSLRKIDSLGMKIRGDAINISFGKLYFKLNDYQKALKYFSKTIELDLSYHPDEIELYRDAYKGIWECQEKLGAISSAFNAYKKYQHYNSKIQDYTKQTLMFQNQIMIERAKYDRELALLNDELKIEQRFKKNMFFLFGGILLIVILIIYILWLRNKSIKQKVELEVNRNKIQELERKNLKEQLDLKNRELTSTAIHLANKNEILSDIKLKIDLATKSDVSNLSSSLSRISYLIKDNLQLDNDWEIFKKHFTEVHPNFFENLINLYPELTNDELKLCAYLKIQLSSKEIARLLNITAVAINKRRNRLRKKLGINSEVDLYEFLLTINRN